MQAERWFKAERLYHGALALDQARRREFLEESCEGDEALKQEVESLLANSRDDTFLQASAMEVAAHVMAARPFYEGDAIGRYRLIRLLGEGGMGTVYEAEQDQPRRIVALKVIKPGFATEETMRRFQHESQALGRLQHSGIAQIYEANTADTDFGPQPYFAMELVRGRPLHDYAEAQQLDARERLALMAKICDAVDHAHQRGVIHRDLKPGNVLVDETAQPKILDFGVALVAEGDTKLTRQTYVGQIVGTLAYMSPEQVAGDPFALDTRSDIYALGVILYELLTGKLPYNISRMSLPEAAEVIRGAEPPALSSVHRGYRGDIETIVAKTLEKDKARRYASAADLAGDIRRNLADEPIAARPPRATYRLRKFVRRHKALVAGAVVVFAVLAAGIVVSTREALLAWKAEQAAEAVSNFLRNDLLAQASANNQSGPSTKPDPDLTVRTALDRAATRIAGKFDQQPEVEAAIRDTIGQTYIDLGLLADGRKQLERAVELERRALGPENPKTLSTLDHLGRVVSYPEAEALYSEILRIRRRILGQVHPDTLSSMRGLANAYYRQSKYPQAGALYSKAMEISRRVLGPEKPDTLKAMYGLGLVEINSRELAQGEALFRQVLDTQRRVLGPEHPYTLSSMRALAIAYDGQGKYEQAEALDREVLKINRRVSGPENPDTLASMNNLATACHNQAKEAQAEALYTQAVEISQRVNGPQHPDTLTIKSNLAETYDAEGKYPQAEALYGQVLEIRRHVLGPEQPDTLYTLGYIAYMHQRRGNYTLAETLAAQVLTGRRHTLGSEHQRTLEAMMDLALAYKSRRKFAESEPLAREALTNYRKKQPDDWEQFRAESLLGASLAGQKKYAEAEPLLLEGYQGLLARKERMPALDRYHLHAAHEWLVQLYDAWGKPEKTAEWKAK